MDKNYVKYKNRYKKKAPSRAEHLKEFQFEKGKSGNPRNWGNLRPMPPWEKGQSGNPLGRPVGTVSLVERLKAYLRRHPEEVEAVVESLVKQGETGNIVAIKELLDRIDGKVAETHRIEGKIPIKLIFVPALVLLQPKEKQGEIIEGEAKELLEEGKEG